MIATSRWSVYSIIWQNNLNQTEADSFYLLKLDDMRYKLNYRIYNLKNAVEQLTTRRIVTACNSLKVCLSRRQETSIQSTTVEDNHIL